MSDNSARFCHLTLDQIEKQSYVWHEENWRFTDDQHSHKKAQLIYVEKGFQYLHVGNDRHLLPLHHCAYIPPGLVHGSSSPLNQVYLRTIYFTIEDCSGFYNEIHIFHTPEVLKQMILYTEKYSRLLKYDKSEDALLNAILLGLPDFSIQSLKLTLPVPSDFRLMEITSKLFEGLSDPIDVDQLMQNSGMSVRTFQRLFRKEMGMSLASYIRLLRMLKAIELLSESTCSISEIAYQVGYSSLATFSNTFKDVVGMSPNQVVR